MPGTDIVTGGKVEIFCREGLGSSVMAGKCPGEIESSVALLISSIMILELCGLLAWVIKSQMSLRQYVNYRMDRDHYEITFHSYTLSK